MGICVWRGGVDWTGGTWGKGKQWGKEGEKQRGKAREKKGRK